MIPGGSLLRGRDFRMVAGAIGLSALGDWVAIVALGLHVKEASESGLEVAVLWVCLFGPSVVAAGQAGLLVDRFETTRLLVGISLAGTAVAAVVSFTTGTVTLVALTALLGLVFAILQPAEFALVPRLAGNRVLEANGHVETARYLGFGLGPLFGGLLYAAGGLQPAMLVDAATFVAVAGAGLGLRVRRDPRTLEEAERTPRARDGVAFLFGDRVLSRVMVVAFSSLLFMSAVWVGELFFVEDVLARGHAAYGLMLSIWTVGMAFGALLLSRRVAVGAVAVTGLGAVAIQGAGLALPALWPSFAFFLACSFVGGLAHGLKNVMFRSLIHLRVPGRLQGRVFAAYNGTRNAAEVGAFAAGGVLVTAIGPRGTLAYAGGISALAGLVGLLLLLRMHGAWVSSDPIGPPTSAVGGKQPAPRVTPGAPATQSA